MYHCGRGCLVNVEGGTQQRGRLNVRLYWLKDDDRNPKYRLILETSVSWMNNDVWLAAVLRGDSTVRNSTNKPLVSIKSESSRRSCLCLRFS